MSVCCVVYVDSQTSKVFFFFLFFVNTTGFILITMLKITTTMSERAGDTKMLSLIITLFCGRNRKRDWSLTSPSDTVGNSLFTFHDLNFALYACTRMCARVDVRERGGESEARRERERFPPVQACVTAGPLAGCDARVNLKTHPM